ncbi:hypothetical protein D9M72_468640 [compost metagenome]
MSWFRFHQGSLLPMALALWGLAFDVATSRGCPPYDLAGGHDEASSSLHDRSLLLILPAALLFAVLSPRFAALAFHLPAPLRPPARLRFVRFND